MKHLDLNSLNKTLSTDSIFENIHQLKALPLGINQDIGRYNQKEKAGFLDSFCIYFTSLSIHDRYEKIQNIYGNICELKTQYGLNERDLLESRYIGLSPIETLQVAGIVQNVITKDAAVNSNPVPRELLQAKTLSDVLGILGLIERFTETNANTWGDFFQKLSEFDALGKLEAEVYAQKYKLTLILEIPELSNWKIIFSALEKKYPHPLWKQKAA